MGKRYFESDGIDYWDLSEVIILLLYSYAVHSSDSQKHQYLDYRINHVEITRIQHASINTLE